MKTKTALLSALFVAALNAQLSAQTKPQFKGVWEPVSYNEDIELQDVFFVNVDVGWAAGKSGTILFTSDGGANWTAQLGGDPADRSEPIKKLRFLDERHGWAIQRHKLLQTVDGEQWEEIGTVPYGTTDLVFISPQDGFLAGNVSEMSRYPEIIYRTRDGGRTWTEAWKCHAKAIVNGLTKNISCNIQSFHFPTPQVGYAVLGANCFGMGCGPPPLIAKTEDGGESWEAIMGPGVVETDYVTTVFFVDEQTGFARLASKKLHVTTDGGQTWRGLVASPGKWVRFADPGVGWAFDPDRIDVKLTYTTDGGKRWSVREMRFPASVNAISMPRRDRAYAVGEHGMVYRYRVVKATQPLKANEIAAPAMPGFDSDLAEQATELETIVQEIATAIGAPEAGDANVKAAADGNAEGESSEALAAPLPAASEYAASCCAKSFSRLEVVLGAIAESLPQLADKYRNLNLLFAAVRMSAELPSQYRSVKGGLSAFRTAEDQETARAAVAGVTAALQTFKQTAQVALQKQLPPPDEQ